MYYIIALFLVFSILGFNFENLLNVFTQAEFNSSVLKGPWTILYGFAIFIIRGLNYLIKKLRLTKRKEIILFYVLITIILTGLEFAGGVLIEKILGEVFWDYTSLWLNIGKYISVEVSLCWGLLATFINYYVYPRVEKWIKLIPNKITIATLILFLIDVGVKVFKSFVL